MGGRPNLYASILQLYIQGARELVSLLLAGARLSAQSLKSPQHPPGSGRPTQAIPKFTPASFHTPEKWMVGKQAFPIGVR